MLFTGNKCVPVLPFESYYGTYLCSLPWQAVHFPQSHLMFLCLHISETAYPVLNSRKSLPPECSGLSWKGRLRPWGFVPNLPVCISGRFWQPGVSLFFLLKVFYSDSLWCSRFYMGIRCSPHIYGLFFAYIACFAFRMFDMVCRQLFRIPANIDILFCAMLHVFCFSYVVPVLMCFWHLIVGGL